MASNLNPIQQLSRVLACAAGILVFSLPLYGLAAGPTIAERAAALTPLQDKAAVEFIAEDLIDAETYVPTLFTADGKPEPLPARTRYYFAGDPVDGSAGTIVQDGDDYANTLLLADGTYRVYAADTFVHDPALDQWREIKTAETDPATFEAVMQAQVDPGLKDLLSGVFVAHAATVNGASSDGYVGLNGCSTWSGCRSATDGNSNSNSAAMWYQICGPSGNGTEYEIYRSFFNFDTSALDGTVSAAVLNVYLGESMGGVQSVAPVAGTGNTLGNAQYDELGNTPFSSYVDQDSFGDYVPWTLNSSGRAAVNLDGVSSFALRCQSDLENSDPGIGNARPIAPIYYAETSDSGKRPYLDITLGGGDPEPEATTTPPIYASSTPGLTLETSIYMLFFTIVFCLSLLLAASVLADWFN